MLVASEGGQHHDCSIRVSRSFATIKTLAKSWGGAWLRFLEFHNYLKEGFRIDLKKFLGLAMPNQYSLTVRK